MGRLERERETRLCSHVREEKRGRRNDERGRNRKTTKRREGGDHSEQQLRMGEIEIERERRLEGTAHTRWLDS